MSNSYQKLRSLELVQNYFEEFIDEIRKGNLQIYNEASIQYELAIFLRNKLPDNFIQLERNVSFFGLNKKKFEKKEIDIVIFNKNKTEKTAIEIKYPTNGQVPEQMFSFCKDIKFLEQLKEHGFVNNVFLCLADEKGFWEGNSPSPIYKFFREKHPITGNISKPTGKESGEVKFHINGNYLANWKLANNSTMYFTIWI